MLDSLGGYFCGCSFNHLARLIEGRRAGGDRVRADAMNIAMQVDIEAPLDTVWSFLDDPAKVPLWMPEVVEVSYPARYDRDNPIGTRFRQIVQEGGRKKTYLGDITAYEKPRLLGIRLGDGRLRLDVTYRLTPMGTGTRVDCQTKISVGDWIGRTLGLFARPMTERIIGRHMDNLKCLAEDAAAGLEPEPKDAMA